VTDERQWRLLLLVLALSAVAQLSFGALSPVLPELAAALGVSPGAVGLVHGMVAVPGIFLGAYLGYLLDRFGRGRVVRLSLLVFGGAGVACFWVGNFWVILGLRFLQGVGASTLLSIAVVVIGDQYRGYRRRWAMGLNVTTLTFAGVLWPVLSGILGAAGTFRPFLLYLVAFPVWVAARHLPEPGHVLSPRRPFTHAREAFADLRRRGRLSDYLGIVPLWLIGLAVYLGLTQTLGPLFLERQFGVGTVGRGLLLAVGAAVSGLVSLASGRVVTGLGRARVIAAGLVLETAGFAAMGLAPGLWAVGLGLALVGAGYGSITPVLQDFATSVGEPRYRGVLVGTWVSGNRLGMFAGPSGVTVLAAAMGNRGPYFVGAALLGLMALLWQPARRAAASRLR
jgi:ACDE family multidrug resistance protein